MNFFFPIYLFNFLMFSNILYLFLSNAKNISALNKVICFACLSFVFIHVMIFLTLMFQDVSLHEEIIPLWLFSLTTPNFLILGLLFISTIIANVYKKIVVKNKFEEFKLKMREKIKKRSKLRNDIIRKIPHVLMFIGFVVVWLIGASIVKQATGSLEGMIPNENNLFLLYFKLFSSPNTIRDVLFSLGWFYYLIFFFFYWFTLIVLVNEFSRKSRIYAFPFNIFCTITLSEEEMRGYGTYVYFSIGHFFAAFTCPPMIFFSILGMSSISDLMASQIGIRFGKKQIFFNKSKTWEGALAGFLTSILTCILFLGVLWSLIFSLAFFFFDIITEKPLKISDNLLIPFGCALIYLFLRFFLNLNYASFLF